MLPERLESTAYEREEERLSELVDELTKAAIDWRHMLEQRIAAAQRKQDRFLRGLEDSKTIIRAWSDVILVKQDRLSLVRRNVEHNELKADRFRQQAGQLLVAGVGQRVLGNKVQSTPILNYVEGLLNEGDRLDLEVHRCVNRIERDNRECHTLHAEVVNERCQMGECMERIANLRAMVIRLQRKLELKKIEFEEGQHQVFKIRDEEGRCSDAAAAKEGEAKVAEEQAKEADREAQELELEIERLCGYVPQILSSRTISEEEGNEET